VDGPTTENVQSPNLVLVRTVVAALAVDDRSRVLYLFVTIFIISLTKYQSDDSNTNVRQHYKAEHIVRPHDEHQLL